jgi:hypothetical protein
MSVKVGPDADTPEQGFRSAIGILGLVDRYG